MATRKVKTAGAALASSASAVKRGPRSKRMDMSDAIVNPRSGLGTWRDKRSHSQYRIHRPLTEFELRARYSSSWLAGAVVDTPAEDMTRAWIRPTWDGMERADEAAIRRCETRHQIEFNARLAIIWTRLFGGAAIIPIVNNEALDQPLNLATVKKGSLKTLIVKDRFQIYAWGGPPDRDFLSPNYGKPLYYGVRRSSLKIHWSRVVRFEGKPIPEDDFLFNDYWNYSELQRIDTAIKDYDGAKENIASMLWEAKIDVIKTALAGLLSKSGEAGVERRYSDLAEGKSNHKIILLNHDEEYNSKVLAFGGVHDLLGDFVVDVCGAARIPMVKLFGQSAPGMNSTGDVDEAFYDDRVAGDQKWQMMPPLRRLYEIVVRDSLGMMPEDFDLIANPLGQTSAPDQAGIDLKQAQRAEILVRNRITTRGLEARELKTRGTYRTMDDSDIIAADLADEEAPPSPPEKTDPIPDDEPPQDGG